MKAIASSRPIRVPSANDVAGHYLETRLSGDRSWQAWQAMHPERMYKIFHLCQVLGLSRQKEDLVQDAMLKLRRRM